MSNVEIFLNLGHTAFTENPEGYRVSILEYQSSMEADEAAEEAYILTNAPDLLLNERLVRLRHQYYSRVKRSLCAGDVVVVDNEYFLCLNDGWKKLQYD
jgi:hypothetical protein